MQESNSRQEKAALLFDAMGGVSDVFLTEAAAWMSGGAGKTAPAAKPRRRMGWVIGVAAALIAVTVLRFAFRPGYGNQPEGDQLNLTFSSCVQDALNGGTFSPISGEHVDYFEGGARFIVKDTATGRLYESRALTREEISAVEEELRHASADNLPSDGNAERYRLWILCGDGIVVTPCLAATPGNEGMATLFDYNSERVPGERFLRLLASMT